MIENRRPVCARIDSFPDATRCTAEVKNTRLARHTRHCQRTAAAKRPNLAPAHRAEETLVNSDGRRVGRRGTHGRDRTRWFLGLVECEETKQQNKGAKTLTQPSRDDEHGELLKMN